MRSISASVRPATATSPTRGRRASPVVCTRQDCEVWPSPSVTDPDTGEIWNAQVFVSVLGASGYLYVEATRSQDLAKIVPIQHANLRGAAYYQQTLMEA